MYMLKLVESGCCLLRHAAQSGDIIQPLDIFPSFLFKKNLCNPDPIYSVNRRNEKAYCILLVRVISRSPSTYRSIGFLRDINAQLLTNFSVDAIDLNNC